MPTDDGLGLDDGQGGTPTDQRRGTPTGPEAGEQDPEKAVPKPQLGAFAGVLKDGDLLPEGEILGGEAEPGCQECSEEKKIAWMKPMGWLLG